ncbi:MAG: hypothetical protein IJT44_05550, partial [Clostridia bacterium]|nr:hypothetical protein [Clostridia bacterium]
MKKHMKRLLSVLLSVVMVLSVFGGLGLTVSAVDTAKAIELVTNGVAGGVLGAQQSSVWFGNYKQSSDGNGGYNVEPVKWRVLSNADGKLFLLADQNLDKVQYNGNHENVTWDTCEIRDWLNGYGSMQDDSFLGTAFTAKEQAAITASTVVSEENPQYSVYGGEDTTDKVFLLSAGEAMTAAYGFTDNYGNTDSRVAINTDYVENRVTLHFNDGAGRWWLRSTGESNDKAAFVSQFGQVNLKGAEVPTSSVAVRPAANVDLGQVLFVSPAVGGKPAPDAEMDDIFVKNAYGKNIMSPVSDYNGFDWKLTVLDSSRSNFTARCLAFKTGTKNATCKIRYSNATGGEYDRISAMIVDADGHVKYSGVLGYANPATTTFETDVTGQYTPGDRIYIYNEEVHGDKQTDYSSRLIDITPEKLPEGLTATVGQRLADVAIPNPEGNTSGTWTWDDPTIEINTAGEYSFPATFTPSNTDAFETIQTNLTVTINKQDLTATPPTGLAATVGQTLADVAIPNPEGNTPGTWTWDTPTIYLNTAGEYSFAATFTPSNTTAFETINTNLTVTVTAEPNYVFPSGLTAYYGQTLNDVRGLPSGWAWDDDPSISVGEVGEHTFPATYTPSDTANYSTVSAMLTVTVEKGYDPDCPGFGALTATYGDTLGDLTLPKGWTWDDDLSTSVGLVGTQSFWVTYTPEDTTHYRIQHACATVIVKPVLITFGSYPQSEVKDADLIAALNAQTLDWQSYGYYCELDDQIVPRDFMQYCDVTLDGAKYRGVQFSLYRPEKTEYGASPESYSDNHQVENGYYTNTIYWFRYEPLQWRVLDPAAGLLLCETVIDSQPYSNFMLRADDAYYYGDADHSYYANNYEKSSIRDWLNADFYNTAFTNAQKSKIAETTLDNSAYSSEYSRYDSASTTDKVFLLSYSDMRNTAYGFESDPGFSSTRGAQVSDYAKCQGLLVQTGYDWWLRSAGEYSGLACTVLGGDSYGAVVADCDVDYTAAGVRPAITLKQNSDDTPNDTINVTITDGIGVNFYLDFAAPSREGVDSATVTYKDFSGETVNETYTKSELALQPDGRYKLTVWIAPAQLADVITVEIGDTVYTQSVRAYCEELKGNQDYSAYFPFVNALEQYAQTANNTFNYTEDTIADVSGLTAAEGFDSWQPQLSASPDMISKIGSISFLALTKPEFRFYTPDISEETAAACTVTASFKDGGAAGSLNARFAKNAQGDVLV